MALAPARARVRTYTLLCLSIADEKFEGFINSVASGEASRLTEQRDPGEISMHPGPRAGRGKRKSRSGPSTKGRRAGVRGDVYIITQGE